MELLIENVPLSMLFLMAKILSATYIIVTVVAWLGNGLIVLVTIRSKKLHSTCNILIAIQAFSDIIIQMSHLFFVYFAYSEQLVTFSTCWKINFLFVSAVDFSTWMVFFTALDRYLCAKYPQFYKSLNQAYYVGGIVTFCSIYCVAFKFITYLSLSDQSTLCLISQSVTGSSQYIWLGGGTLINCGVVVVYYALTKIVKNVSSAEYQRINRSLNTMILVYLFGWLLTYLGCGMANFMSTNERVFVSSQMIFGIFANINIAAPVFIYYSRSTLYRQEFRKFLGIGRGSRVTSMSFLNRN